MIMICHGVVNKGPHDDRYDDRRPVKTEKFSVLTQVETCAAHEQQGGWVGGGVAEGI